MKGARAPEPVLATVGLVFLGVFFVVGQVFVIGLAESMAVGAVILVGNALLPFILYKRPVWNSLGAGVLIGWAILTLLSGACFGYFVSPFAFLIGGAISAALGWGAARMLNAGPWRLRKPPKVDVTAFD